MQLTNDAPSMPVSSQTHQRTISLEWLAYIILISAVVLVRLANLGTPPMTEAEASRALPAYHAVFSHAPGTPQTAASAINFWLQRWAFVALGGTELAARLPGVVAGTLLMLLPLLIRHRIGRERAFLFALILAFSPVAIITSRLADPVLWTMIFACLSLIMICEYHLTDQVQYAYFAIGSLSTMIALTGTSGLLMALILALTALLTLTWELYLAPDTRDTTGEEILTTLYERLIRLPWLPIGGLVALFIVTLATGFFTDTAALNTIAVAIGSALQGFVVPAAPHSPNLYALLTVLTYEPLLVILLISSITIIAIRIMMTTTDRFMIAWVAVIVGFWVIYRNTQAAFALWLIIPAAYLIMRALASFLYPASPFAEWQNTPDVRQKTGVVACVVFASLIMLAFYLSTLSTTLFQYATAQMTSQATPDLFMLYGRVTWFVLMLILWIILYLLLKSIWEEHVVMSGYALGILAFMLMVGIGTGWNTTVNHTHNPVERWYRAATADNAYQLRQTLIDLSRRHSRGFPTLALAIVRDEQQGITDDGLIAWLVRDFGNAQFVDTLAEVQGTGIIILPANTLQPDLNGDYVGRNFVIQSHIPLHQITPLDWLSWFTHRKVQAYTPATVQAMLWLRMDIYDDTPTE